MRTLDLNELNSFLLIGSVVFKWTLFMGLNDVGCDFFFIMPMYIPDTCLLQTDAPFSIHIYIYLKLLSKQQQKERGTDGALIIVQFRAIPLFLP